MEINCLNLVLVFMFGCVLFGPAGGIIAILLVLLIAKEVKNIKDSED